MKGYISHDTRKNSSWCQALKYTVYKYTMNCQSKQGNEWNKAGLTVSDQINNILLVILIISNNIPHSKN